MSAAAARPAAPAAAAARAEMAAEGAPGGNIAGERLELFDRVLDAGSMQHVKVGNAVLCPQAYWAHRAMHPLSLRGIQPPPGSHGGSRGPYWA